MKGDLVFDNSGVLVGVGTPRKRGSAPAHPQGQVVNLPEAAEILGMRPDEAHALLSDNAVPRVIGYPARDVRELAERKRRR